MTRIITKVALGSLLLIGCGLIPKSVSRADARLIPMWAAIARVDRASLGFTPIDPEASIRLEGKQLWGNDYDAMLHIDGATSRTIAFRKVGPPEEWKWIGEQEIHTGPRTYKTPDGTFHEEVVIGERASSFSKMAPR